MEGEIFGNACSPEKAAKAEKGDMKGIKDNGRSLEGGGGRTAVDSDEADDELDIGVEKILFDDIF